MFGIKAPTPEGATPDEAESAPASAGAPSVAAKPAAVVGTRSITAADPGESLIRSDTFRTIRSTVFATMNMSAALMKTREQVRAGIEQITNEMIARDRMNVTLTEQSLIINEILNDMFGLGPIEPLLADESVTDILVNGPDQVYVERHGRLELTFLKFRDDAHVINVAQRIAAAVGRRVDESSPMVDARLADGSRVNVVLPPLSLKGACIAIRKFSKRNITLQRMAAQGNLSLEMVKVLEIASACRLNIVISGGTGSGKTTLLNALSHFIDERERVLTIEDAAELQLQQPHVVSLETRPENAEGSEYTARRHHPAREHGDDGQRQSAFALDSPADRQRRQPDPADRTDARRRAARDPDHRTGRHGRRRDHYPGSVRVPLRRRLVW